MRFSRPQLLLIAGVAVVVVFFTVKGLRSSTAEVGVNQAAAAKMYDIVSVVEGEEARLTADQKLRVQQLADREKDTTALKQLVVLWDSLGRPVPAAYYMMQLAEIRPTETNWFIAGSKYYTVAAMSSDSLAAMATAIEAKRAFEKVLEINPRNLEAKNALAACYVEVDQDVMKGVGLLKEVVETDSNNVQAIFTLGMLSVRSGQFEKAQERFEKLVTLQPFNPEFYFYLGEVYAKSGDPKKAILTYEKCKTLLKDQEAKKEVESIINKLKTI